MTVEELRESLMMSPKNGYKQITPEERQEMNDYCKRYMAFMDACKKALYFMAPSPRLKKCSSPSRQAASSASQRITPNTRFIAASSIRTESK